MSPKDEMITDQDDYDRETDWKAAECTALTTCYTCKLETDAPLSRTAGDFVACKHCGNDAHTGQRFDDWLKGNALDTDQPQIEVITPAPPPSPTAHDFLTHAGRHMDDRAVTYDSQKGERSMGKTVASFNALTGHALTEEQGWLFMELLKKARSQQGQYRADNYEDAVAYAALRGECAAKERQPC